MDVAEWLRGLGLEQYEPAFRANEIDAAVLPSLTAEDLKDLGVSLVGHRRRLLDAIAALGATEPPPSAEVAPRAEGAERRQLTVMFCDLVGSTALSTRHDPEDLRELIGGYHRAVAETVRQFDGFVAKYMGDGVLIYFGYPQAHEDDAERAVRAGLAVIEAVGKLPAREDLRVRLGIATGLAVVGDLIGEGAAQERGVVGETPNLAARLQALAMPNTLVIAEATRRQVGGLFDLADLGPQQLAGFAEPQRAWRVIGESGMLSRFEALRSGETPLVGREEEVELLVRRWQQAKSGEGRVVLISGEPGIGKSRLTAALSEHIKSEPHTRLRYFCSPHHQDSALYPFIAQLERAAGFARDDVPETKLDKLATLLGPAADAGDISLLVELLSLPGDDRFPPLGLSPQRKKELTFTALLRQPEGLARQQPILMIFEDLHWIDPTSREFLDLALARIDRLPVLLVATFRPEFQPPWTGRPHVTVMSLNRLGRGDGAAMVARLAGNAALLPPDVVAEIIERTDGVPLFVEEMTKAVVEAGAERGREIASSVPGAGLGVPATLQASLMARLDRLGPTPKEIAQIGAVLGREFDYELIEPVAQHPERELQAALDQLGDAGLLFCRGIAPHSSYLFKHALVQDAAYSTLLRGRRQGLHACVAAVLEEHFRDVLERQPELLAHHLTAAGDTERAVDQWREAGRYAAGRSAHFESIGHFDRGLGLLGSLPQTGDRDRQEVELQLGKGLSLLTAKGFSSAEATDAYTRVQDLCERSGDVDHLFVALWGLWITRLEWNFDEACRLSDQLLKLAEQKDDVELRLQAHHAGWWTSFIRGDPATSRAHCEAGCHLYDPERHQSHTLVYGGHDARVCALSTAAWSEWLLGYPDKALARANEGLTLAEGIGHAASLLIALLHATVLHQFRREPEMALQRLRAAEILAAQQRLALVFEPGVLRGGALTAQRAVGEAVASIREGLAERDSRSSNQLRPYYLALLSEALEGLGDHDGAGSALTEGLAAVEVEGSGERWWEAELHRLTGTVLLAGNKLDEGEISLQQAIRTAQAQQAKSLELRAAASLARLWDEQGRRAEARDLLAPVYGWFTEGFDTADLKEAKALVESL